MEEVSSELHLTALMSIAALRIFIAKWKMQRVKKWYQCLCYSCIFAYCRNATQSQSKKSKHICKFSGGSSFCLDVISIWLPHSTTNFLLWNLFLSVDKSFVFVMLVEICVVFQMSPPSVYVFLLSLSAFVMAQNKGLTVLLLLQISYGPELVLVERSPSYKTTNDSADQLWSPTPSMTITEIAGWRTNWNPHFARGNSTRGLP